MGEIVEMEAVTAHPVTVAVKGAAVTVETMLANDAKAGIAACLEQRQPRWSDA